MFMSVGHFASDEWRVSDDNSVTSHAELAFIILTKPALTS